jgi:Uri superfamily endonuclease
MLKKSEVCGRVILQRVEPMMRAAENSGRYQLLVELREKKVIGVGRHGRFSFPAGYYVYTGSAVRGLDSRIARHMRRRKRMRWHIDYLLRYGRVLEVKRYSCDLSECELSRRVEKLPGSRMVVRGFGSSDCRCSTHLFHFRRNPAKELNEVQRRWLSPVEKVERMPPARQALL